MRLFVTDRPTTAVAIAEALPGHVRQSADHIRVGDERIVWWSGGHLLEPAGPEHYDERFRVWRLEDLPIVPNEWRLVPRNAQAIARLAAHIKQASRVVHAASPDREGQLLIDELLDHVAYAGPVDRLHLSDLGRESIERALGSMASNAVFAPLRDAARARQRADWLVGINLSRLATLLLREHAGDPPVTVGRVQTAVLSMVVERDRQAQPPPSADSVQLRLECLSPTGRFFAVWTPRADLGSLTRTQAAVVVASIKAAQAVVTAVYRSIAREPPDPPFSLTTLQIAAAEQLGLDPAQTLALCQTLHDNHRAITHPHADHQAWPVHLHSRSPAIMAAILARAPGLEPLVAWSDPSRRSAAWQEHATLPHAIMPTSHLPGSPSSSDEAAIYGLIARNYMAQFYGPRRIRRQRLELEVDGHLFVAAYDEELEPGWTQTLAPARPTLTAPRERRTPHPPTLPLLVPGAPVEIIATSIARSRQLGPEPFTDAGILAAMLAPSPSNGLGPGGSEQALGTTRSRTEVIDLLCRRKLLTREGGRLSATGLGRRVIDLLPPALIDPRGALEREAAIAEVARGALSSEQFLASVVGELQAALKPLLATAAGAAAPRPAPKGA